MLAMRTYSIIPRIGELKIYLCIKLQELTNALNSLSQHNHWPNFLWSSVPDKRGFSGRKPNKAGHPEKLNGKHVETHIYWPVKSPCWHPAFKSYLERHLEEASPENTCSYCKICYFSWPSWGSVGRGGRVGYSFTWPIRGHAAGQGMGFGLFVLNRVYNLMHPGSQQSVLNRIWFQLRLLCPRQGSKIVGVVLHTVGILVYFLS